MNITSSIFRENDIRGTYPEQINENTIKLVAYAIARKCKKHEINSIAVGRDGRISGPSLLESFCDGLLEAGIHVNNIGLVTSPLLYFAAKKEESKSGIMITGSHNPKNHNGIKMVIDDKPVSGTEIFDLIRNSEEFGKKGEIKYTDIKEPYLEEVSKNIFVQKPEELKVVLDCGNGAAGCIAPDLFKKLGFSVIELFSEIDGNFPNHHPDPGKLENLKDLIAEVEKSNADVGLAFDGDGDRVGLVTNNGDVIFPDKLMMLFSKDILSRNKGKIVFDVKCSNQLENLITEQGGIPIMSPTGHFHIKKAIKKNNALLGGEMSGHIFFNDRWPGFDDGIYAGARMLEILANSEEDIFASIPSMVSTPEINIPSTDEEKFQIVEKFKNNSDFQNANIIDIDGIRVEFKEGWGLLRASNTSPVLVLRFEAETEIDLINIKNIFFNNLKIIKNDIKEF